MHRANEEWFEADSGDGVRMRDCSRRVLCSVLVKMNVDMRLSVVTMPVEMDVRALSQNAQNRQGAERDDH
jgi:hypothetical protein